MRERQGMTCGGLPVLVVAHESLAPIQHRNNKDWWWLKSSFLEIKILIWNFCAVLRMSWTYAVCVFPARNIALQDLAYWKCSWMPTYDMMKPNHFFKNCYKPNQILPNVLSFMWTIRSCHLLCHDPSSSSPSPPCRWLGASSLHCTRAWG